MEESNVLLGKRKVVSRFIKVQGETVLKSNMYSLESGEPSVWDKELNGKEIQYSNSTEFVIGGSHVKKVKKSAGSSRRVSTTQATSKRNSDRMANNLKIKTDKQNAHLRRIRFVRDNWEHIKKFVQTTRPSDKDIGRLKSFPSYPILTKQPSCLCNVNMRDYQLAGINWLIKAYESGISVILGDEMGLGKTLQTIAYLGWMKYVQNISGPFLIIVPLSVLTNWINEFKKFLPQIRVLMLHSGDIEEKERLKKEILPNLLETHDVVVTTYEMAKHPAMKHSLIGAFYWRCVILDEGHIVRNENSNIAQAIRKMHFEQALLLTGTPLQNNLHELWSLLNFLQPEIFPESALFDACFDISGGANHRIDKSMLLKVHAMLKPFMLRRIKADVEKTVPPKVEKKILCPLSAVQSTWYKRLLLKDSTLLMQLELEEHDASTAATLGADNNTTSSGVSGMAQQGRWKRLQSLYMQLRKVCNHPFLFPEADPHPQHTDSSIIEASGKLQVLDRLLVKLQSEGHRVVLFSQFTSVLDILVDYLEFRGFKFCRLDGSTNRVRRQVHINSFNRPGSPLFVFLMSTRAGGLGVNLQTADTVILYDSDWNPQADLQAMARVHRIGQKKVVHVYRLVSAGTVEERIVQRAEKKLYLDQMVNRDGLKDNSGESCKDDDEEGLGTNELLKMLKFGADVICQSAGKQLSNEDIDSIVARIDPSKSFNLESNGGTNSDCGLQKVQCQKHSALEYDAAAAPMETRIFEGSRFDKYGPDEYMMRKVMEKQSQLGSHKRQRTERIVNVTDDSGNVHQVFKENMYDMENGITSVFEHEYANDVAMKANAAVPKRKVYRAGHDYENENFCLQCWDGGDLMCCDRCPAAFHSECLSKATRSRASAKGMWSCSLHRCSICNRSPAAAGGLLFRCSMCPTAYCEDHLPSEAVIINICERLERTCGYLAPSSACYIQCSAVCIEWAQAQGEKDVMIGDEDVVEVETMASLIDDNCNSGLLMTSLTKVNDTEVASVDSKCTIIDITPSTSPAIEENTTEDANENPQELGVSDAPPATTFLDLVDSLDDAAESGVNIVESLLLRYRLPLSYGWIRCEGCAKFHSDDRCPTNFSMLKDMEGSPHLTLKECQETLLIALVNQVNYCSSCRTIIKGKPLKFLQHFRECSQGQELSGVSPYGFRVQDTSGTLSLPLFRIMNILPRFAESIVTLLEENVLVIEQLSNGDTCINIARDHVSHALNLVECAKAEAVMAKESNDDSAITEDTYDDVQRRIRKVEQYVIEMLNNPEPVLISNNSTQLKYVWGGYYLYRPFAMSWIDILKVFNTNQDFRSNVGGDFGLTKNVSRVKRSLQAVLCDLYEDNRIQFIDHQSCEVLSNDEALELVDSTNVWKHLEKSVVISLPVTAKRLEDRYMDDRKIEQSIKNLLILYLHKVQLSDTKRIAGFLGFVANRNLSPEIYRSYPQSQQVAGIPLIEFYLHPVFVLPKRNIGELAIAVVEILKAEDKIDVFGTSSGYYVRRSKGMVNEDICLVCNDGGDLICCDRCPAAYHMECIPDERKPIDGDPDSLKPSSKWLCPRHFCVECNIGEEELLEGGALQGSRTTVAISPADVDAKRVQIFKSRNGELGMTLQVSDDRRVVISRISPYTHAGALLKLGDEIVTVNHRNVHSLCLSEVANECLKPSNSVWITYRRGVIAPRPQAISNSSSCESSKSSVLVCCTECPISFCMQHLPSTCPQGSQDGIVKYADTWERVRVLCNFSVIDRVKYAPCSDSCAGRHNARRSIEVEYGFVESKPKPIIGKSTHNQVIKNRQNKESGHLHKGSPKVVTKQIENSHNKESGHLHKDSPKVVTKQIENSHNKESGHLHKDSPKVVPEQIENSHNKESGHLHKAVLHVDSPKVVPEQVLVRVKEKSPPQSDKVAMIPLHS